MLPWDSILLQPDPVIGELQRRFPRSFVCAVRNVRTWSAEVFVKMPGRLRSLLITIRDEELSAIGPATRPGFADFFERRLFAPVAAWHGARLRRERRRWLRPGAGRPEPGGRRARGIIRRGRWIAARRAGGESPASSRSRAAPWRRFSRVSRAGVDSSPVAMARAVRARSRGSSGAIRKTALNMLGRVARIGAASRAASSKIRDPRFSRVF